METISSYLPGFTFVRIKSPEADVISPLVVLLKKTLALGMGLLSFLSITLPVILTWAKQANGGSRAASNKAIFIRLFTRFMVVELKPWGIGRTKTPERIFALLSGN